jgi:hypothetical protein
MTQDTTDKPTKSPWRLFPFNIVPLRCKPKIKSDFDNDEITGTHYRRPLPEIGKRSNLTIKRKKQ